MYTIFLLMYAAATPVEKDVKPVAQAGFPGQVAGEFDLLVGDGSQARKLGTWMRSGRGLRMTKPRGFGHNLYFPRTMPAFRDGVMRVRFQSERNHDLTLLFRASAPADDLEAFNAYGLTIYKSEVRFTRFEDGYSRAMDTVVELPDLRSHRRLELVVTALGPHLNAQLFDGDSLESIAVLSVTDERYVGGEIGLRLGKRVDVERLSALTSDSNAASVPDALVGTRMVRLAASELSKLDETFESLVAGRDGGDVFLRLDPVDYERFRRVGVTPISVSDHVPWRFTDPAYEAARTGDEPAEDAGYKNSSMVEDALRQLNAEHPDVTRLVELGQSAGGKSIWALKVSDAAGRGEREPAVLFDAAQHGVELWSTELVLDIARTILSRRASDARAAAWVRELELWFVPLVNPDGRDAFMEVSHLSGRKNARDVDGDGRIDPREGVDLNRNFPFAWGRFGERGSRTRPRHPRFRGPSAASELEVQALMKLARRRQFAAAVSVHTSGTVVLPPYATLGVRAPERDEAWAVAQEMVNASPRQINGRRYRLRRRLYPVDGVWKDWLRYEHGTVAMVIEGPYHNPVELAAVERSLEDARPVWQALLERTVKGPVVRGWVENENGKPVAARVEVVESKPRAGERWRARRSDGYFVRYLDDPFTHTLSIRAPGYEPLEVTVGSNDAPRAYVLSRSSSGSSH